MLKEYEFFVLKGSKGPLEAPMEHALSVVDGEFMSVDLVGRRVAYSAFGEVIYHRLHHLVAEFEISSI